MTLATLATISLASLSAMASPAVADMSEELVPDAANIEEVLLENELLNSESRMVEEVRDNYVEDCFRETCAVYIEVNKRTQRAIIKINGETMEDHSHSLSDGQIRATTGMKGHGTPSFDRHFETPLRAYSKYSSSKYPGGNWIAADGKGYGNMPFVVFIKGGFGVHGTTGSAKSGNISKLGTVPLSHGCVRIHPLNAKAFNEAARTHGAKNSWIWVHD